MRRIEKAVVSLAMAAMLMAGIAVSVCWSADGVQWQPGFPMRAGNQVLLMWMPYPGADAYQVIRRDLQSQQQKVWDSRGSQYVDAEAPTDRTFLYTIQAIMPGGIPGATSEVVKLEGFRPLEAPKWVGHYQEGQKVHLAWEGVKGAAFYNLYRAGPDKELALLASVQDVAYVDADVRATGRYVYSVRAVGLQSQESPSSEALIVTVEVARGKGEEAVLKKSTVEVRGKIHRTDQYRLREPTDVAVVGDTLLITDLGSRSVLTVGRDGSFLFRFGLEPPEYEGVWGIPWGIGVGPAEEEVALTFLRSPNIRVFRREGDLVRDFVLQNPALYKDSPLVPQPMDVAVDAKGEIWVTDYTFAQVVHLDAAGREVGRVGNPRQAKDSGPFRSPTFITYDMFTNRIYVVDSLLAEVFALDMTGEIVGRWARPKATEGAVNLPKGICMTNAGDVLLVDGIRSSLQGFSSSGEIQSVYYSKNRNYLDLRGLVSVAEDPKTKEIYILSKVDSAVYRLQVVEGR